MCGITAYIGSKDAISILYSGLKRLEYRGYDSVGICTIHNNNFHTIKKKGKVDSVRNELENIPGNIGIGHTRWATHGEPTEINAHPHFSDDIALVHNGIIENYVSIKKNLIEKGYIFLSETDTEVLVHLIHDIRHTKKCSLIDAVRLSLILVTGTFGIVVISKHDTDNIIVARRYSPLLIGIGDNEFIVASDASAIIEHTKNALYLNDDELYVLNRTNWSFTSINLDNIKVANEIVELNMKLDDIQKGHYQHFMIKEIFEQPLWLTECMRGRIKMVEYGKNIKESKILLGGILNHLEILASSKRIIICACGTSWHSALVGEYLIESLVRIPVEVEYASEFRYRNPILTEKDVVFVISQSGETADTLAAVRLAKQQGCTTFGIVNVVGSSIAKETHAGVYLHAGPEIGVASTKAFTAQVTVLIMLALNLAKYKNLIDDSLFTQYLLELEKIPNHVEHILLKNNDSIKDISRMFRYATNFIYLGRGLNFPVALEGALKLKEISYIHAEGYPAAELKHGPIALIDNFMPVVCIAMKEDPIYDKIVSNIEEVRARKGIIILITNYDNDDFDGKCEIIIKIPTTINIYEPLLTVLPLQLLAYHVANIRGCNIDQPKNLAKSVTVE